MTKEEKRIYNRLSKSDRFISVSELTKLVANNCKGEGLDLHSILILIEIAGEHEEK